jgi:hypothetical protein
MMNRWWCIYWPAYALVPVRKTIVGNYPYGSERWGLLHVFGVRLAVWTVRT